MRAYVLTRLDSGIPVQSLHESALSAMKAFNERYFGPDFGTTFPETEGWEPYDIDKHGDQQTDGLPDGADAFVFSDEDDLVFVVGLEIQP